MADVRRLMSVGRCLPQEQIDKMSVTGIYHVMMRVVSLKKQ